MNRDERISFIKREIKNRIFVLDGAMGTMIQKHKLQEEDFRGEVFKNSKKNLKGNNDILSITRPDIIREIHAKYLEAGADIIETNTFNSTSISMSEFDLSNKAYEIALKSTKLAREIADKFTKLTPNKPRFVAGVLGPTGKTASISPDVNNPGYRELYFDDFVKSYNESAKALIDGGADFILIETVFDTLNCKAAIYAVLSLFEEIGFSLPIMISATITDISGRTLSGQTIDAFWISVEHAKAFSVGLNCALGPEQIHPYLSTLSQDANTYVSCHPNAGLPDEFGIYRQTPTAMAEKIKFFAEEGLLNIVGGCCGTTPEHIREITKAVEGIAPRQIPESQQLCRLSGLEEFTIRPDSNFINVGERTNISGSKKFADLIKAKKYEEALSIAKQQIENGAQIIDINVDDSMLDSEKEMRTFLNLLASDPEICKIPIMIDSSKWDVLLAGLKCVQGKSIVNSISLKEGEDSFKKQAIEIEKLGSAIVIMAFDEHGQADSYEKKIAICSRAYNILVNELKIAAQNIIFDPAILAIATGIDEHNSYAMDYINATIALKGKFPLSHISGGVSNLSFSFRGNNKLRESIHSVFLYHAIKAGMDMGIVNAGQLIQYDDIPKDKLELLEDVILNRKEGSVEKLVEAADTFKDSQSTAKENKLNLEWRNLSLEERISYEIVKGITDFVEEDMKQALNKYSSPVQIIETPLMNGMKNVGDLFGAGKMFLPQVIRSARVMKKAVEFLSPYIEGTKDNNKSNRVAKIVMATVKGDVHDIGKNIVNLVLRCNNYDVIDLGVMTPCESIIAKAISEKADIIGVSGLITPSLEEMTIIAKEMEKHKMTIPLLIGGATTSSVHTAVKIAPAYSGPIVHVKDASVSAGTVSKLLGKESALFIESIKNEQAKKRELYAEANRDIKRLQMKDARERRHKIDWEKEEILEPSFIGIEALLGFPIKDVRKEIDWTFFFKAWDLKGIYPSILKDERYGKEAERLLADAQRMLDKLEKDKSIKLNAIFGIYPSNSIDEIIEVYPDKERSKILANFHFIRQQEVFDASEKCLCMSDIIAPKNSGRIDYTGFFVTTAGIGVKNIEEQLIKEGNEYDALLLKTLADRLAEAFASYLNKYVMGTYWTKDDNEGIRPAIGYPCCPDHTEKAVLFNLLDVEEKIGVSLTETFMMSPAASTCGFYFVNKAAKYFSVGKITEEQLEEYSKKKGMPINVAKNFLSNLL